MPDQGLGRAAEPGAGPGAGAGKDPARPVTVAVLAIGGQGGGVLTDWLVDVAEGQGWHAQSTSVPGVAQRTGATLYYAEMMPPDPAGRRPVLSLMPAPGGVDLVVSLEWMEAGRAVLRGIVTQDRTVLVTSSHRALAVGEKIEPGDGAGDPLAVRDAAVAASRRLVAFDMEQLARRSGSAISAVALGAVSGSGALPFPPAAFEAAIKASGIGVEASLAAFALGAARAAAGAVELPARAGTDAPAAALDPIGHAGYDALAGRARRLPAPAHPMLAAGLRRVVDFQDVAYGSEYLDRLETLAALDRAAEGWPLASAAARHVAVAMAYDDAIRVADLKTRRARFSRLTREVAAGPGEVVGVTEYMHPRLDEILGTMPAGLGRAIERRPGLARALGRALSKGRRVRTSGLRGFLLLFAVSAAARWRRGTLRHAREQAHLDDWLARVRAAAPADLRLAVALVEARRLVKGYSDTHARGLGKFGQVMQAADRLAGRSDAAEWVERLTRLALKDADGVALDGALRTLDTFVGGRATETGRRSGAKLEHAEGSPHP